jgi:hypothetical protein
MTTDTDQGRGVLQYAQSHALAPYWWTAAMAAELFAKSLFS